MKIGDLKLFGGDHITQVDRLILSNRLLWIFFLVGSLGFGLQMIGYFRLSNNVSLNAELPLVPSNERRSLEVGYGWASEFYFDIYARFLTEMGGNFKKEEVKKNYTEIKSRLRPDAYAQYYPLFDGFTSWIISNRIDMSFDPYDVEVIIKKEGQIDEKRGRSAKVNIKGIANVAVGKKAQDPRECSFMYDLIMLGGRAYVEGFQQTCIGVKPQDKKDQKGGKKR